MKFNSIAPERAWGIVELDDLLLNNIELALLERGEFCGLQGDRRIR